MNGVRIAIAGVGNCASALLQGIEYYQGRSLDEAAGLLHSEIGGYQVADVHVAAAFDVDCRKVGRPLEEAVFAAPNCTTVFQPDLPEYGVTVHMGNVLDGVADHMRHYPEGEAFRVSDEPPCDTVRVLRESAADVLVCYLPVGSEQAVRHYAQCCLRAGVAMVNCVPVFIASSPEWAERFRARKLPIVGDDVKSQVGATITHRVLARLMRDRGVKLDRTYQLNTGGNTDFLNMVERTRLESKRISKTEAVLSEWGGSLDPENIHIGPSDYVAWQKDNKVAFIRMEWRGFGGVANHLELRLSVEDSPNSAGVVIDAIRCAKLALDRGIGGPLDAVCSFAMKHPPRQRTDSKACLLLERWIEGKSAPQHAAA